MGFLILILIIFFIVSCVGPKNKNNPSGDKSPHRDSSPEELEFEEMFWIDEILGDDDE